MTTDSKSTTFSPSSSVTSRVGTLPSGERAKNQSGLFRRSTYSML